MRPPDIPEIVFGDAAEEVRQIVGRIDGSKDIEILDGFGIFPVDYRLPSPEKEDIGVILRKSVRPPEKEGRYHDCKYFPDNTRHCKKFPNFVRPKTDGRQR